MTWPQNIFEFQISPGPLCSRSSADRSPPDSSCVRVKEYQPHHQDKLLQMTSKGTFERSSVVFWGWRWWTIGLNIARSPCWPYIGWKAKTRLFNIHQKQQTGDKVTIRQKEWLHNRIDGVPGMKGNEGFTSVAGLSVVSQGVWLWKHKNRLFRDTKWTQQLMNELHGPPSMLIKIAAVLDGKLGIVEAPLPYRPHLHI